VGEPPSDVPRKFYFDGGQVEIVAHLVHELDPNGKQLRVVKYTDYAADCIRSLAPTSAVLRSMWADAGQRNDIIDTLAQRGISFDELIAQTNQPEADPFDLLCHLAFNAPLRTRRERAQRVCQDRKDFFDKYSGEARQILEELLDKYAEHGDAQFVLPDVLRVPPISSHGNTGEIIRLFGSPEQLRKAVTELQGLLYGA
jgi:type I restriction enzyme R subunit